MTHQLPPAWLETTIDELFRTIGGGTPATGRSECWGDGVPWITSADIDDAGNISPRKAVTPSGIASSATNPVPPGSVVVVTRVGLGKVGLAKQELCFSQDCQALLFNRDLLVPSFVAHQVRCKVRGIRGRGTTIAGVTVRQLGALTFSLAPVPEQQRIVEAIDSYLTRVDDAVASLERVQAKLKAYHASVLKAAAEGRLVPTEASLACAEKRDYEPAEVLLTRILKERRRRWEEAELAKLKAAGKTPKDDKWKAKYQEPVAPDTRTLPELPEGWCWTSLSALIVDGPQNGIYVPKTQYGEGTPILRIDDYQVDWSRSSSELQRVKLSVDDAARYGLSFGDLVLNRVNSPSHLGKTLAVEPRHLPAVFESNMMRFRPSRALSPRFLHFYLTSAQGKQRLTARAKWAVNQASINQQDVGNTAVPLPPESEQVRLVAEIDRLFSVVTVTAATVEQDTMRAVRLRQAVLKWAFEGKLVDQDPSDEPADKLLAHIRAERAAVSPTKKNPGRQARGAA